MVALHYIYVSCETVFKLVATVYMGYFAAPMLSALHSTDRGLSYITLRVLLSSMLFGNLCLDISLSSLQSYYWAVIMSLIPQILGALFSYMLRGSVDKEWRVLLIFGSTFQNGLTFPLSVVTSIKNIKWLDEDARKDCEQYVFLYNLTCAVGLWSIGNPLVKYFKDKYAAEQEDAALESYYALQESSRENAHSSLPYLASTRLPPLTNTESCQQHQLSGTSRNNEYNNNNSSVKSHDMCNRVNELSSCTNDIYSKTSNINQVTMSASQITAPTLSLEESSLTLPLGRKLNAQETLRLYRPIKHKDRPIAIVKYDSWRQSATQVSQIANRTPSPMQPKMTFSSTEHTSMTPCSVQRRRNRLPLWSYFLSVITSYFYPHKSNLSQTHELRNEVDHLSLRIWDRSWCYILHRIFWIVWGALNTLPVMLTILAIIISLVPPFRAVAETRAGLAVIGGIATLGKGCVPIQLITLGITLAKQYEPLSNKNGSNRNKSNSCCRVLPPVEERNVVHYSNNNNTENIQNGYIEQENRSTVTKRWYHIFSRLNHITNITRFIVLTIALRLLFIPALSFLIVHCLIKWKVMPNSKPFVVSILVGISSPAAVNCSLVCIMQQYHPNEFARMIFYMYCFAVITSTFWIAVSIAYASGMPELEEEQRD